MGSSDERTDVYEWLLWVVGYRGLCQSTADRENKTVIGTVKRSLFKWTQVEGLLMLVILLPVYPHYMYMIGLRFHRLLTVTTSAKMCKINFFWSTTNIHNFAPYFSVFIIIMTMIIHPISHNNVVIVLSSKK